MTRSEDHEVDGWPDHFEKHLHHLSLYLVVHDARAQVLQRFQSLLTDLLLQTLVAK